MVHLLASLSDSFDMLVTALEASPIVPAMELVTERLLHEEQKMQERDASGSETTRAIAAYCSKYCGKPGHFKRNSHSQIADEKRESGI